MIALRFHREVYPGPIVDEAVKRFAGFASVELTEEPQHWVVQLTAATPARERQVAGELGNYALGVTVQKRNQRP